MFKFKSKKQSTIMAGIALVLVILGVIFKINTFLLSAVIGIFLGSIVQIFSNRKSTS